MRLVTCFSLFLFIKLSSELNNGVGRTPQMGWNSWYGFRCTINETIVRQTADALVATGLAKAGYQYVNLDGCWEGIRDADGTLHSDPETFPSGIAALADYAHSRKLKFGIYTDRGNLTCDGRPGSLGYETKDSNTFAWWGVDYVKVDSCYTNGTPPVVEYSIIRDALNATGRSMFYAFGGGITKYDLWLPYVGNSWRTADDIQDNWPAIMSNIDQNNDFAGEAGPGGWNDPDMLQIGNGGMSETEYKTHFSLWSISKAPLLIGSDVRNLSAASLAILTNSEMIAVNQDPLGIQGKKVAFASAKSANAASEVIVANCSSLGIDQKRRQWTINPDDGSLRSAFNGRCLSIDQCSTRRETYAVLNDCQINDPHALCQGKNQQWTMNTSDQTIVSQLDGFCLEVHNNYGPNVYALLCTGHANQMWTWNATDGTVKSKSSDQCLTVPLELEVWAGPLSDGSQAVLLLNRSSSDDEEITVKWSDIDFPLDRSAAVRDLWTHQDLGIFTSSYTSPSLPSHGHMMLKITLTK